MNSISVRSSNQSFTAIALAIGFAAFAAPARVQAQIPATDRFDITLSHPVTIGNRVLDPGIYSLNPLDIAGGDSPVLSIRGDNGLKFETAAMIARTVENRVQPETRVILRQVGQRYYFDKIWVKGQAFGYRFPLPKGVKGPGTEIQ
jgi:hypothetical protein